MRYLMFCAAVMLLGMVAPTVQAADESVQQQDGHGSLAWRDGGQSLVLRSHAGGGVHVVAVEPDGTFGLHVADRIAAVDGVPVARVGDLLDLLRDRHSGAVELQVRHGDVVRTVPLQAAAYRRILPPAPPAPPAVPARPAPPLPPPPPPAPDGHGRLLR